MKKLKNFVTKEMLRNIGYTESDCMTCEKIFLKNDVKIHFISKNIYNSNYFSKEKPNLIELEKLNWIEKQNKPE